MSVKLSKIAQISIRICMRLSTTALVVWDALICRPMHIMFLPGLLHASTPIHQHWISQAAVGAPGWSIIVNTCHAPKNSQKILSWCLTIQGDKVYFIPSLLAHYNTLCSVSPYGWSQTEGHWSCRLVRQHTSRRYIYCYYYFTMILRNPYHKIVCLCFWKMGQAIQHALWNFGHICAIKKNWTDLCTPFPFQLICFIEMNE